MTRLLGLVGNNVRDNGTAENNKPVEHNGTVKIVGKTEKISHVLVMNLNYRQQNTRNKSKCGKRICMHPYKKVSNSFPMNLVVINKCSLF